ncbi:aldehyde dehydrogenase family protein [Priestia megaterium]|uniref:aldehyde dehydrogenase family protein n=1 Tax=Priestia megaterium TaxID=1404 RepID=UPI00112A5D27|nr:aldehyde dehydrogenase family protein [Priestia megaterium]TPF14264.1 aldehyde dehydrogenase family protein [Priestia megaterium]TPF19575.1 aldehyde dehydrogenase family protein [Priestia megaterium]
MKIINQHYINSHFVKSNGNEVEDLINPTTKKLIGRVTLGNEKDVQTAIAAAKEAFKLFSKTTIEERSNMLQRLHDAIMDKAEILAQASVEEYGSPASASYGRTVFAAKTFLFTKEALQEFEFERSMGKTKVIMEPLGVIGAITPWNANYTHICGKIAPAIATGCTIVVKPSEISALQTKLLMECINEANIPAGVINIVNGSGAVVGAEMTRHPDIAKISFTGSTNVGKLISKGAVDTLKRLALELGGKSPNIILEDANFNEAIPMAVSIGFSNTGQACHAGTRLIVPENRLEEVKKLIKEAVKSMKLGNPVEEDTILGPLVSQKQFDTVQRYIKIAIDEGAELVTGGLGHPEGFEDGYFVKPTVFANVTNDMTIAREEIFGPVLSIITYKTEEQAIEIANDTIYGLAAYVSSSNLEKAKNIASKIVAGRVLINKGVHDDPYAPFGGFKQSGIGRDSGIYGLEEHVEPKAILSYKE